MPEGVLVFHLVTPSPSHLVTNTARFKQTNSPGMVSFMKYRVIGSNRDTGARMTLEFECESRARAEQKATQQGMNVNRIEDFSDGEIEHAMEPKSRREVADTGPGKLPTFIKLGLFVLAAGALVWYFWPKIVSLTSPMLHR
jgi:hypothetical protein